MSDLATLLHPEVERILVLLTNPGRGNVPPELGFLKWQGWKATYIDEATCLYEDVRGEYPRWFVKLENIHGTEGTEVEFGDPIPFGEPHATHVTKDEVDIQTKGNFERTYTHTFERIGSLLESTKKAYESNFGIRAGEASTGPASYIGAHFNERLATEYTKQFTDTSQETDTITAKITQPTPAHFKVVASRETEEERWRVRGQIELDYKITLGFKNYPRWVGDYTVTWTSKEQLLEFVRGEAPDSVGVWHGLDNIVLADRYRQSPQPQATIDNSVPAGVVEVFHPLVTEESKLSVVEVK